MKRVKLRTKPGHRKVKSQPIAASQWRGRKTGREVQSHTPVPRVFSLHTDPAFTFAGGRLKPTTYSERRTLVTC